MPDKSILSKIEHDFVEAYKAKDDFKVSTLRLIKSSIKNLEINLKSQVGDDEVIKLLTKEVKQRREAMAQYLQGNRQDLADKENNEIKLLELYLPKQLEEEEIVKIVRQELDNLGITHKKDFGKAMGAIMAKMNGQADGSEVAKVLNSILKND